MSIAAVSVVWLFGLIPRRSGIERLASCSRSSPATVSVGRTGSF
jgi:hypothetical protein